MIEFLEALKTKIKGSHPDFNIEIQSRYEQIFPDVRLEPIEEEWEHDNLGNVRTQQINFNVTRYISKGTFSDDVKAGEEFQGYIYGLIKDMDIIKIFRCKISSDEVPEQMLVAVNGSFTVKLYKRR